VSDDGWREVRLGDITNIIMGQSPRGTDCNNEGIGLPLLNGPTEFTDRYPLPVQYTICAPKIAAKGSILFCVRGSTTGRMNWADREYAIGRGIASISSITEGTNQFIKAILDLNLNQLLSIATGSTFPNVSKSMLNDLKVLLPPLPEQKAIAATLSALDDMIELNNKINKILEEMAQAIFKSWFEDFEPFKEGEFEESELGLIPKGWRVGKLGGISTTITKGTTPTTLKRNFVNEGINFIKAETITENHTFDFSKFAYIDEETNELLKRSKIFENDILITIAGTIGRYAIVPKNILPANTNQAVGIIRINQQILNPLYVLCYLLCNQHKEYIESRIVQAVQANLSLGIIADLPILIPLDDVLSKFYYVIEPIFEIIKCVNEENQNLTAIRDTLLPKLMSGEIRVPFNN